MIFPFPQSKHQQNYPPPPPPPFSTSTIHPLQQAFTNIHTNCSAFLTTISTHFNSHLSNFAVSASSSSPNFARIPPLNHNTHIQPINNSNSNSTSSISHHSLSNEVIEERLAGIPVYALSNSREEFVFISGTRSKRSLGLFCFNKEDADAYLDQMKLMDPDMRRGSSVVAVALSKVVQLKVNGVGFRLIPDAVQIKNAINVKEKAGSSDKKFMGVPVFQSRSLILRSEKKRYIPVFFRKEDLENSLVKASQQQRRLNPLFKQGDLEVVNLEDIIKGMKDDTCSTWDDVVFIPPGFDVETDPSKAL